MTVQGEQVSAIWKDPEFARGWASRDDQDDLLGLPRRLAAALVAADRPGSRLVVDIASGPGAFLETFLTGLPEARGVWSDASPAMMEQARERLAPFGDRVTYQLVDMTDLRGAGLPGDVDVLCSSRASHHLDRPGLRDFYTQAAALLAPGGWLVNLDHVGPEEVWNQRLRSVKKQFGSKATSEGPKHNHNYPLCSIADHLDGYRAADVTDVDTPWRAFYSVLFTGRKPGG